MQHIDVAFYYLRKKIRQYPELEQRKVTTVDTFFAAKVRSLWTVYQAAPDKFDWACCDSVFRIMLGVRAQSGVSWFHVNTVLMPIHFSELKHWALAKLDLTNWTLEVYDSLQHEGHYNNKVREGMEGLSKFIPFLAEKNSVFEFKPRVPPGNHPIPVTIMKDIPKQANGLVQALQINSMYELFGVCCLVNKLFFHLSCNRGDCGMFTIKYAECLIEGRDVKYWVIAERMQIFREYFACHMWSHAKNKLADAYKSDADEEEDV